MSLERAPRVLLAGAVLAQPMSGVRRRAAEILPRVGRLLAEGGGGLTVLEGRNRLPFPLPDVVERLPSRVPAGPPIARALHEERELARAVRELAGRGRAPDLVHTAHFPVPRRLPVPFTVTVHDLRSLRLANTPFSRRLVAKHVIGSAVRRAACTIAVSRTVADELASLFEPRRVVCVPNAADHLRVHPRRPQENARLLVVGHVERRKNLELLLEALARAPDLPGLEVVGGERAEEGVRLRERARALGVAGRVRWLGPVDDEELAKLYAETACVVLPSRLEGYGLPAAEALRAGAPLAVADAGALPEVAGPDVPRFAPNDPAGCVAALRAALATPAEVLRARRERTATSGWDDSARLLLEAWSSALPADPAVRG